jgi:CheY-like chemotaxis protein
MANNAIWIVDDDKDDHELVREILAESNYSNKVEFFHGATPVLNKLADIKEAPFIIISDINLPGMDGFELREKLLNTPDKKFHSVPFIFWSTHASEAQIDRAFKLRSHGFFVKEPNFQEWKKSFLGIIEYWSKSKMPSKREGPDPPLN